MLQRKQKPWVVFEKLQQTENILVGSDMKNNLHQICIKLHKLIDLNTTTLSEFLHWDSNTVSWEIDKKKSHLAML